MADVEMLIPLGYEQKSYHGKAVDLRGFEWYGLRSYTTPIAWYKRNERGVLYVNASYRHSVTTAKHLKSWRILHNITEAWAIYETKEIPDEIAELNEKNLGE